MEPAGVTLPRVLGHENAGWVEEIGTGVTTVAKGDAVLVYPPYSCGLCVAVPPRQRHALRPSRVHRPLGRRRLRRLRARVGALAPARCPAGVEPAAVAPHADAGLTAYHAVRRLAHLADAGNDRRRDRRRGRRSHRAPAPARARIELGDRGRHGRAAPAARGRARGRRRGRRARRGRRGARPHRRPGRRPRLRLRRHRPDARRLAWRCSPAAAPTRSSATAAWSRSRRPRWSERARVIGQPRRHLDRPLGAPAAARRRPPRAEDRDAPAGLGQRRAREARRRRGHRPRGARALNAIGVRRARLVDGLLGDAAG